MNFYDLVGVPLDGWRRYDQVNQLVGQGCRSSDIAREFATQLDHLKAAFVATDAQLLGAN
jgi:hypothetical protein